MKRGLFLALRLRPAYDGAQDYDLILRAPKSEIVHIPKVLYHWRVHKDRQREIRDIRNMLPRRGKPPWRTILKKRISVPGWNIRGTADFIR
jgi:hypothetical protein